MNIILQFPVLKNLTHLLEIEKLCHIPYEKQFQVVKHVRITLHVIDLQKISATLKS